MDEIKDLLNNIAYNVDVLENHKKLKQVYKDKAVRLLFRALARESLILVETNAFHNMIDKIDLYELENLCKELKTTRSDNIGKISAMILEVNFEQCSGIHFHEVDEEGLEVYLEAHPCYRNYYKKWYVSPRLKPYL